MPGKRIKVDEDTLVTRRIAEKRSAVRKLASRVPEAANADIPLAAGS